MDKIIDEVKNITAAVVAKKQDAAKLNYPKIIAKIKAAAQLGNSSCMIAVHDMNEYDKQLLEKDGFRVWLMDEKQKDNDYYKSMGQFKPIKIWEISW